MLLDGKCIQQETELPDDLTEKSLEDLTKLVTVSKTENKVNNTKKVLERVKTVMTAEKTADNAKIALQLLV